MRNLKIFFDIQPKYQAFGGSVHFVANLLNLLKQNDHDITFQLQKKIDLIIIVSNSTYKYKERTAPILKYKKKNPNTKILHRVNNCDLRKNTKQTDKLIFKINKYANKTIFVSNWLAEYFIKKGFNKPYHVIQNGCNSNYFYPEKEKELGDVIKLITHHWSNNWMKGFDIYTEFDNVLLERNDISFTYVGNYYPKFKPRKTKIIPPSYGIELGEHLRAADIYLTASRWEPGGNHYAEGGRCGLPILYHKDGGGVNELCKDFGLEYYDIPSLLKSIEKIKTSYHEYRNKIPYDFLSSERCCEEYYSIISNMF